MRDLWMDSAGSRQSAAGGWTLRAGEAHIWRAWLDSPAVGAGSRFTRGLLAPDELERAGRFYFENDRRRFVAGRGILRLILGGYLRADPRDLVFTYGPGGKPSLAGSEGATQVYFNVSHSGPLAFYVCTRAGEAGIDVERVREIPDWEQIAAGCFTSAENECLRRLSPGRRETEFFRLWTRHEAMLKALGVGLNGLPSRGGGAVPADHACTGLFRVHGLRPGCGCAAAVAVGRSVRRFICLAWPGSAPEQINVDGRERSSGPEERERREEFATWC